MGPVSYLTGRSLHPVIALNPPNLTLQYEEKNGKITPTSPAKRRNRTGGSPGVEDFGMVLRSRAVEGL
jgi:hypothetical protein